MWPVVFAGYAPGAHGSASPSGQLAEALRAEGADHFARGDLARALDCFSRSLILVESHLSYGSRSLVYNRLGQHAHALADARAALAIAQTAKGFYRHASALMALKLFGDAVRECDAGMRARPDSGELEALRALRARAVDGLRAQGMPERSAAPPSCCADALNAPAAHAFEPYGAPPPPPAAHVAPRVVFAPGGGRAAPPPAPPPAPSARAAARRAGTTAAARAGARVAPTAADTMATAGAADALDEWMATYADAIEVALRASRGHCQLLSSLGSGSVRPAGLPRTVRLAPTLSAYADRFVVFNGDGLLGRDMAMLISPEMRAFFDTAERALRALGTAPTASGALAPVTCTLDTLLALTPPAPDMGEGVVAAAIARALLQAQPSRFVVFAPRTKHPLVPPTLVHVGLLGALPPTPLPPTPLPADAAGDALSSVNAENAENAERAVAVHAAHDAGGARTARARHATNPVAPPAAGPAAPAAGPAAHRTTADAHKSIRKATQQYVGLIERTLRAQYGSRPALLSQLGANVPKPSGLPSLKALLSANSHLFLLDTSGKPGQDLVFLRNGGGGQEVADAQAAPLAQERCAQQPPTPTPRTFSPSPPPGEPTSPTVQPASRSPSNTVQHAGALEDDFQRVSIRRRSQAAGAAPFAACNPPLPPSSSPPSPPLGALGEPTASSGGGSNGGWTPPLLPLYDGGAGAGRLLCVAGAQFIDSVAGLRAALKVDVLLSGSNVAGGTLAAISVRCETAAEGAAAAVPGGANERLVLITLATATRAYVVDALTIGAETTCRELWPLLASRALVKLVHGADADARALMRAAGVRMSGVLDTQLVSARVFGDEAATIDELLGSFPNLQHLAQVARPALPGGDAWAAVRPLGTDAVAAAASAARRLLAIAPAMVMLLADKWAEYVDASDEAMRAAIAELHPDGQ
ncbi:hypothetical protein KFE25_011586 [Diacronema lutheri]|uniref:3'-5' exonuclease domain-containing protein n=2 Tax=Diacronema lutheri TaxID=2081491 RepID=A0A8J5XB15_DIALT|nr:hypothetical protein KFE25_011586 [Diacronema lutheri]